MKEPADLLVLSNVMRSGAAALVKTLATRYALEGIRFNNIMPGRIDTERVRQRFFCQTPPPASPAAAWP